jgi:outer membrane receptor protein involved in Fe transport
VALFAGVHSFSFVQVTPALLSFTVKLHLTPSKMKPASPAFRITACACKITVCLALALSGPQLFAQAAAPTAAAKEEPLELSPFVVNAGKDDGYAAQETLVGTRLRSRIADTPVSLTVMTAALLDDLGATDFKDVADFVPSTQNFITSISDPTGNGAKSPTSLVVRGFTTNTQTKDFFLTQTAADRYLTDQITFTRGPNALLFGIGNPGGIVAVQTNRASFNGSAGNLQFVYDEYDSKRVSLGQNVEVVDNRLAVRGDFLLERSSGYRVPTERNKDGIFLSATVRPFKRSANTTLYLSYEYGLRDDVSARPFAPFDGFSTWVANGTPLFDNFVNARPPTVFSSTTPFSRAENSYVNVLHQNYIPAYLTSINQLIGGRRYNSFVQTNGRIINGSTVTPANGGGDSIAQDFVSINPLDTLLKNFGGDRVRLEAWLASLGAARAVPESFANGPVVVPMTTFLSGGLDRITQRWNTPRLILNQRIGQNFDVELAANSERFHSFNRTMLRGTDYSIRYDPNLYLPDGKPNPYAGVPYVSNEAFATLDRADGRTDEGRVLATYKLDLSQKRIFGFSLGRHMLSALGNFYRFENEGSQQRPYVISVGGVGVTNAPAAANILRSRYYLIPGQPTYLVDPFVPLPTTAPFQADWINFSGARTKNTIDSYALATQSFFLKERLVLTGGARWDHAQTESSTQVAYTAAGATAAGRYPGEVDLPATYATLNPVTDDKVTNYSAGVVYHVAKPFSPFFNYSTNSNPGTALRDVNMNLLPYLRGAGRDYGFQFNLFKERLQGAYTHYRTEQKNVSGATDNGTNSMYMLMNTNMQLAEPALYAERNALGLSWRVRWDQVTNGDELQFTFNPSRNLRLRIAASRQKTITTGRYVDVAEFLERHIPVWTAYANAPGTPAASSQTVLTSLPQIQDAIADYLSINGSPQIGESEYSGSLAASYSFNDIRMLRGLRIGTNISYRGRVITGYQVNADGSVDLSNVAYASGPKYINANISYGRAFRGGKYAWSLTLEVANLLDDADPIVRRATWDYTINKFVNTSNSMREPRNWQITSKISWR